jgi:hypothetical protein
MSEGDEVEVLGTGTFSGRHWRVSYQGVEGEVRKDFLK